MTNVNTAILTYEDYRNAPGDVRYELLEGELVMIAAPNMAHQRTVLKLGSLLSDFVERNGLGEAFIAPTDVVLSDSNVVQPDVLFVSRERMSIVDVDNVKGSPDLVVEIVSPNNPERDLVRKRDIYSHHGVGEYWVTDPDERSIRVMTLEGDTYRVVGEYGVGDTLVSVTLKDLTLDVTEVFGGLP